MAQYRPTLRVNLDRVAKDKRSPDAAEQLRARQRELAAGQNEDLAEAIAGKLSVVLTEAVENIAAQTYANSVVDPIAGSVGYQDFVYGADTVKAVASTVTFDSAEAGGGGTTFAHTVGAGTGRYLVVGLAIGSPTVTATGVTYNGVPLTQIKRTVNAPDSIAAEIWGLANPDIGTFNVIVTWTGAAGTSIGASSWFGVSGSTPISDGAIGHASNVTGAPITGTVGDVLVDMVASSSAITAPNGTQRWNDGAGDGSQSLAGNGAPQQLTWTSPGANWASVVAVLPHTGATAEADYTYPVTGSSAVFPLSVMCQLTTSATVANRTVALRFIGPDGVRFVVAGAPVNVPATTTQAFCWQPVADVASPVDNAVLAPLPQQMLFKGSQIQIHVGNVQAGDSLSQIRLSANFYPQT